MIGKVMQPTTDCILDEVIIIKRDLVTWLFFCVHFVE